MLKQTLINRIYKDIKFRKIPKTAIAQMLESCFDHIVASACQNESSYLSHFGTFYPTQYLEKKGHNPNTKEPLLIPAQTKLKFKASEKLINTLK